MEELGRREGSINIDLKEKRIGQGCTKHGCQVAMVTKICAVTPDIIGSLVWKFASCHPSGAWNLEMTLVKFVHPLR